MESVLVMGVELADWATYISCDEHMVGLVGELARHSLSDLVDREPLCMMSATTWLEERKQTRLTYAFPVQCVRRDDLLGSTDYKLSPFIFCSKRLLKSRVQLDVQASHVLLSWNAENGSLRFRVDHDLGPEIREIRTDQAVEDAPWCFAGLAFHGKTGNGFPYF
jgi:hypothetical protein